MVYSQGIKIHNISSFILVCFLCDIHEFYFIFFFNDFDHEWMMNTTKEIFYHMISWFPKWQWNIFNESFSFEIRHDSYSVYLCVWILVIKISISLFLFPNFNLVLFIDWFASWSLFYRIEKKKSNIYFMIMIWWSISN